MNQTECSRIQGIFSKVFIHVTKSLANIDLIPTDANIAFEDSVCSGIVVSRGIFSSMISCCMDVSLIDSIINHMSLGCRLEGDERKPYLIEYLNIAYGRAISEVNNYIKSSTRFNIPIIISGEFNNMEILNYEYLVQINFMSDYGKAKIAIAFDISLN